MTNAKERRRHLHALTRRAEHLRQVLASDLPGMRTGRSYDVAELSALKAAIEALRETYERQRQGAEGKN